MATIIGPEGLGPGIISEEDYLTYQKNKSSDEIRAGVVETPEETLNKAIEGQSLNNSGMATSTDLGKGYIQSLYAQGLISESQQKAEITSREKYLKESAQSTIEAKRILISEQFARQISEAQEISVREISGARAQLTRMQGGDLGYDSSLMGALQMVREGGEKRIAELQRARTEAMARVDLEAAQRLGDIENTTAEALNSLYKESWQRKVDLVGLLSNAQQQQRLQIQQNWDIVSRLKKGTQWMSPDGTVFTGISEEEGFGFTPTQWLELIQSVPLGETQPVPLPDGTTINVVGIGKPDIKTRVFNSTNPVTGEVIVSVVDEQTGGLIKQTSLGRVGERWKSEPTETTKKVNPQVEALAQSYLRGESLGNIGGALKGQVLARVEEIKKSPEYKEKIKPELKTDIQQAIDTKDYTDREDLINRLVAVYPELTLDEIAAEVYSMIPDVPEQKSFFQRLFGK